MTWEVPDRTEDHYPEGACSCGLDLADAADLGVSRSFQQEEIPAAAAERVQHDLHSARCACGKTHVAPRPAGVPDSALSIGPRLRALAVYLVVFQHVPVERCRQLIADVAGAAVSEGFIHSCLARAASLAGEVVALIRALITALPWPGSTRPRCGPGRPGRRNTSTARSPSGTPRSGWATRSLDSMQDAGILPGFAGIVVSDRYQNYFHPRWEHIAGNQACLSHLLRDYEDCAESYPGAVWPVQAQRALRGLIHAWHAAREQGLDAIPAECAEPLEHEFRHAVLAGLASVPRVPGPKNSTKQKPGRELLEFCRDRRSDVLLFTEDTSVWPTNNISERGVRPAENPAEDLRPPGQRRRHPGPARHPQLHRHRPQARQERHGRPARPHARQALATARAGILPVTGNRNPRYPSPRVHGLIVYDERLAHAAWRSLAARYPGRSS